ncbi:carboxylating nicotinate-nucleotide diphosphorylase [Marinicella sp. S1101]|uniref:carboxylating nicotinate-nucleotide diphosphorylase n=1 Tax=Marinicella marina TaxID=2996016 RepID=UPI0022609B42|nr:carboxylating nicotinate-nucleotide diphosphorylase [Marinicella marina]MCX7554900.1 carboxylating nicotinate-nucleotide diphosphorylase [Marinicella marina]MDJ1141276.1 carboxylating nicotinate-nucleotide diphosphorylase [Marinicella marina]
MNPIHYRPIIASALLEDIQSGDLTSEAIFPPEQLCTAQLIAKQAGTVAGIEVFKETFLLFDSSIEVELLFADGEQCADRDVIAKINGPVLSVLGAERVALNLLQRMSGIATLTHQFVQKAQGKCKILDTRKTAPNLRVLDKWAVTLGGGVNHRHGLYDMAMLKENHIKAAGGITQAVNQLLEYDNHQRPIEVEVTNLTELKEALDCPVDRIMLDNMDNETMAEAVKITADKIDLEASGNVNLDTIEGISLTGVDYVSIGALTHSVKAMDYSLLVV